MHWPWQEPSKEVVYRVVEVEKLRPLENTDETAREVATLRGHSGFQWLVRKLKLQAANLRHELETAHHEDMKDVIGLQSGIFWCNWLQSQVDFAVERVRSREATPSEIEFFNQISSTIERIGHNPSADSSS